MIDPPKLQTGSGEVKAVDARTNDAGNFDYRRGGFRNPKNLKVWAIVRLGQMRLTDRDLENFENTMSGTARDHGMNLEMCTGQENRNEKIMILRLNLCSYHGKFWLPL